MATLPASSFQALAAARRLSIINFAPRRAPHVYVMYENQTRVGIAFFDDAISNLGEAGRHWKHWIAGYVGC